MRFATTRRRRQLAPTRCRTDLRGVFAQPEAEFLAIALPPALIADERHNSVYYSLRRTLELLGQANPNILELLYMPADCVR